MDELLCHRCGPSLEPGQGDWYMVKIEAIADPTPPEITPADLEQDVRSEIAALVEQLSSGDMSEQELMDGIYRRLIVHLCGACYRHWIEKPV